MNKALGSAYELSLRLLLILGEFEGRTEHVMTADRLAALDFITVYAGDFGASDRNLHGYGRYRHAEFPARRALTQASLKTLALNGYVRIENTEGGFGFALSERGADYAESLECSYADDYRDTLWRVVDLMGDKDEMGLIAEINIKATRSPINRRYRNG